MKPRRKSIYDRPSIYVPRKSQTQVFRRAFRLPIGVLFMFMLLCLGLAFVTLGSGKVVKLDDGDSFTILSSSRSFEKIRLYGIDCPELGQEYGPAARAFTDNLVFLKTVSITPMYQDSYGRTIAMVELPDGRNLNEELIRNGQAWVEPRHCKEVWCASWKRLENNARQQKLGLWAKPDPTPPWKWRQTHRR